MWFFSIAWADDPAVTLVGRVLERGSGVPLACEVMLGTSAVQSGPDGRFVAEIPAGPVDVTVTCEDHRPLAATETAHPGTTLEVEYRVDTDGAAVVVYGDATPQEASRKVL